MGASGYGDLLHEKVCMSTKRGTSSTTETTSIPGMGAEEQSIVARLQQLGVNQADALQFALEQAKQTAPSPLLALQGADKALLDQAYAGAEANLRRFGGLMGQDLAGTRGLNPSDTPVSEAVLREVLPQMQMLASQKAQQELGLGLNLGQIREQARQFNLGALIGGAQATPFGLSSLADRMQRERFAQASRTSTTSSKATPGLMDSIGQGIGLAGQLGELGSKVLAGMPGGGSGVPPSQAGGTAIPGIGIWK